MADAKQLKILYQGSDVWNKWRDENCDADIDLSTVNLSGDHNLSSYDLSNANFINADLEKVNLSDTDLSRADLRYTNLSQTNLKSANLKEADLTDAKVSDADLSRTDLRAAKLYDVYFSNTLLQESNFSKAELHRTTFTNIDLSDVIGLEEVSHWGPSTIGTDTLVLSKGNIPEGFPRGCGLSDWEIEQVKLYNPDLSNDKITQIQYRVYELRATQPLQISPLFVSYSHADDKFVDKIGNKLTEKGIRYWRDIHDMKAGRMEKQIDQAIRQNPTVLLVLSEHSLSSDWVEHEVRTAHELEKEMERDVVCPVTLDDSWRSSRWPKRVMEQIMEYNILDFSAWKDDSKFDGMFRKLIDGLELFYKG